MAQTNLTIRIDEEIKRDAETLFDKLGFSLSGVINVFFRQAIREQGIPFQIEARTAEDKYNEYFNPHNMKILMESIADINAGKGVVKTMAELEAMSDE